MLTNTQGCINESTQFNRSNTIFFPGESPLLEYFNWKSLKAFVGPPFAGLAPQKLCEGEQAGSPYYGDFQKYGESCPTQKL
jgi:hypothetical protein